MKIESAKKLVTRAVLLAVCGVVLSMTMIACNTVEGAGKDIKAGGKAIENAASDAKD